MARIKNKPRSDGLLKSKIYLGTKDGRKQYNTNLKPLYIYGGFEVARELQKKR